MISVLILTLPTDPLMFKQRIDHFHFTREFQTFFDERYYINDNWYKPGTDTMVLRIGSESELKTAPGGDDKVNDIYGKIARDHNGMIFALEHRFYGQSQPFRFANGTIDITNDRLRFLDSNQAQSDLLYFAQKMDEKYCTSAARKPGKLNCKWIIIGGSYPGALDGWMLQKHGNAFVAGIAASGVVQARLSLPEFDQNTFSAAGTPCAQAYRMSMREIEDAMENGDQWPVKYLKIDSYNLQDFYYFLADTSLMVFQYGNWTQMCHNNLNPVYRERGNVTKAFLDYISANYNYRQYDRDDLKTNMNGHFRQWWYQTCTEVGYFEPAPEFNSIRSQRVDLEYHYDVCNYAFGLNVSEANLTTSILKVNNLNGGYDVFGENTVFTNFWQDVWKDCGLREPTANAPHVKFLQYKDGGHCVDLHLDDPADPQVIRDLRQFELDFVNDRIAHWRVE